MLLQDTDIVTFALRYFVQIKCLLWLNFVFWFSFLHAKLRTATLRHNIEAQATLQNLLLRNYLHYNLYDQADKLVAKSTFPEQASNHEWARYLYYLGKNEMFQSVP